MLELVFNAFIIGCISWVYHIVLREKLLSDWFYWGFKNLGEKEGWRYYLYQPIFNCEKCFAGQLALWSFFFLFNYQFKYHIAFIVLSILFVTIITKWTK